MQRQPVQLKLERSRRELYTVRFRKFCGKYNQQKTLYVMIKEKFRELVELPMLEEQLHKMQNRQHNRKPRSRTQEHDSSHMKMDDR